MTLTEVSQKCKVSKSTVRNWIRGYARDYLTKKNYKYPMRLKTKKRINEKNVYQHVIDPKDLEKFLSKLDS